MCTPRFLWIPAQRMHTKMPKFHDTQRGPAKKNCQNEVSMSNCKQTILKLINDNKIHSRYFKVIKTDFLRILSSEQGQKCGFLILKLRTFGVTVNTIFVVFVLKHTFQQLLAATLDNFLPFDFRFGLTRRHFLPIIRDF